MGVVTGLAWTALGGATLYIETLPVVEGSNPSLRTTGSMGDVMKESTSVRAYNSESGEREKEIMRETCETR